MPELHWRDSQRSTRFFMFDARAALGVALWVFHARWWTFYAAIAIMIFFWILERKGLNFVTAFRTFRTFLIGVNRPRNANLTKVKMKDYG